MITVALVLPWAVAHGTKLVSPAARFGYLAGRDLMGKNGPSFAVPRNSLAKMQDARMIPAEPQSINT